MNYQIHWDEGLFLQPHHLQQMQHGLYELMNHIRRQARPYAYGISDIEVSEDELGNNLLRFRRLSALMPSGTPFIYPGNCELPTLDLGPSSPVRGEVVTVLLGLPLWQENRGNCATAETRHDTAPGRFHYALVERLVRDENTGDNEKPVAFRVLNARLLLDTDDRSDFEVIPLVRLIATSGNRAGRYRLDPDFIGPCLHGSASTRLNHLLQDVVHLLDGGRAELRRQVTQSGFAGDTVYGRSLEAAMRLGALTRAATRLKPLLAAPHVPPFAWYLELVSLLADVSIFESDHDLLSNCEYNHEAPVALFLTLHAKIKSSLKASAPAASDRIEFKKTDACYVTELSESQIKEPAEYYLIVRSKQQDSSSVARLVEDIDRFKLMPPSQTRSLEWGIRLKRDDNPPPHLNVPRGSLTFKLDRSSNPSRWKQIEREKSITAYWREHRSSDFELALHMTLPN